MISRLTTCLLVSTVLLCIANLPSQAQQLPSPKSPERKAWHASMIRTHLPHKGCFNASYPATKWQEVPCTTAPNFPLAPANGAGPNTVGSGYDYVGVLTSGLLSQSEGSFPTFSNVTSSNAYSLQLNTNWFSTSACSGAANPSSCRGWQQFVFASSGSVFMQYWLINWGTTCPSGWTLYTGSGRMDCYKNSSSTSTTSRPISSVPYITLTATASGGTDTVLMDYLGGNISAVGMDSVLGLESGWDQAEFNVFGNNSGHQVSLNSNASLVVQISLVNGTTNTPTYSTTGFTGETNNLNLISTAPCLYGGATPTIQFMESNASGATASCGTSAIQTNIAQVPYDTNVVFTQGSGVPPSYLDWSMTLVDSTPGVSIHYTIYYCDQVQSGTVSPGYFDFELSGSYISCSPYGTMYATAPGYFTSPVGYFSF